jgi:ABC-type multidrug transport system fused ATPase/permease subunit
MPSDNERTSAGQTAAGAEEGRRSRAWPLIKRFWPWVRPHMRYVWAMFALLLISTPLSLISPLIVRRVVDDAVQHSNREDILIWGAVLVAMTVVNVLLNLGIGYAQIIFHTRVLRDLRLQLYLALQRLSQRYYSDKETGYLMSRQVDDVDNLEGVMADAFARAGVDVVRGVGYVLMVFYIEWRMALGALVLVGLIFGFQYAISGMLRERSRVAREKWTEVSESLHQSISGYSLVQATASERREARHFTRVLHTSVRAQVRQDMFSLLTSRVFALIGGVAPTIIVLAGVYLIVTSDFTVGGLFAFFMYLAQMFGAVGRVASLNSSLQPSVASLERIYEVLDTTPDVVSPQPGLKPEILEGEVAFAGVTFAYRPDLPVLHDIDLTIAPRTMVALVGPSGAGKTTLAQLILRFFDPTDGRILIDGNDLRELNLRWYRQRIGLVPQDVFLFDRSVAENISYGNRSASQEEMLAAAAAANALEFIEQMPEGFDTLIGERGVKLSGGQRQRIAIAREFLRNPRILILDEATSSLDSATERLIQQAMETLLAGRTSVVIAHRLSTVLRADKIVVLDEGSIVEVGRHDELLDAAGLYAALYQSQFADAV